MKIRDSLVGTATGYRPDDRGIFFFFDTVSGPVLGPHLASCPMGIGGPVPGGNAAGV